MKAEDLERGDVFRTHIYGEVLGIDTVADGKRIKVRISLENQGGRSNSGSPADDPGRSSLEFTDSGSALEFLCLPSRNFNVIEGYDDDDDDDDDDNGGRRRPVEPSPAPSEKERV